MRSKAERDEQRVKIANAAMHSSLSSAQAIFEAIMELCRTLDDVEEDIVHAILEAREPLQ